MRRNRWHPFIARVRTVSATRRDPNGPEPREDETVARLWGVDSCERCGRTFVLAERPVRLRIAGRSVIVCPECFEPAPAVPTWTAAPTRLSQTPVRLAGSATEATRAA
jgi:hypothetical protein